MTIIRNFESRNGGTNNIHSAQVLDARLNIVKSFNSRVSYKLAFSRAEKFISSPQL